MANPVSNSISVIDGTTGKVLDNNITVGRYPAAIAVNPTTNKVYVANSGSNSVSVIDGSINDVVAGVTFNIHPSNAGHIKCNNDISTNVYVRIRSGTQCKAEANSGFVFSSWSENLGHNSSKTITTSPISDSWTSLLNAVGLLDDNSTFQISEYGNFIANFEKLLLQFRQSIYSSYLVLFSVSLCHPFCVGSADIIKGGIYTNTCRTKLVLIVRTWIKTQEEKRLWSYIRKER